MKPVRRYLVIIQAPGGYPARGQPLEPAPEPPQPTLCHAVLADDYEQLEAEADALTADKQRLEVEVEALTRRLQAALAHD